jgi:hypothetical protein
MIDAGLGNTTVLANLAQQQARYTQEAYGDLGTKLAERGAGITAQIGQAGLNARMQGTSLYNQYVQGGLGHLGQQLNNPAGQMIGQIGPAIVTPLGGYGGGGGGLARGGGGDGRFPYSSQLARPGGYVPDPYNQPGILGTYGFGTTGGGQEPMLGGGDWGYGRTVASYGGGGGGGYSASDWAATADQVADYGDYSAADWAATAEQLGY